MDHDAYHSGIMAIPDDIKRDLLSKEELEIFDMLTDDEKKDVFNSLEVENTIVLHIGFAAPLSTLRLISKALEISKEHMPELSRDSVEALRTFFFNMIKGAMLATSEGRCPHCDEEHDEEDAKHRIN